MGRPSAGPFHLALFPAAEQELRVHCLLPGAVGVDRAHFLRQIIERFAGGVASFPVRQQRRFVIYEKVAKFSEKRPQRDQFGLAAAQQN
jgi:hypothetical protein